MSEKALAWHSPEFYPAARAIGSQKVGFIEHHGRRILTVDFSHTELEAVRAIAAEYLHVLTAQPANSVLSLIDVEEIAFSPEVLKIGAELTEMGEPSSLKTALSGVTGFRSFMLQTILKNAKHPTRLFKERSEALAWLIANDNAQ